MIGLIDLCDREHPLSRDEFVLPIAGIVRSIGEDPVIRHYTESPAESGHLTGIILCGTALKDNGFMRHLGQFEWLRKTDIPVLGICAGMQVMVAICGGTIRPGREIGMTSIRILQRDSLLEGKQEFPAYELHGYSPVPTKVFRILAASDGYPQILRHCLLPWVGVLFHPEVRNEWVVKRFVAWCGERMD